MKQYEFEAINRKRGNVERIRATAKTEAIARAHIVSYYGAQFDVMESCCDINPPHHIIGEIDCSDDLNGEYIASLVAAKGLNTMRFYITDLNTGKELNVTDLVIDTLEQGEAPAWDDSLTLQGIEIAADIARSTFGHNNIDAGTK